MFRLDPLPYFESSFAPAPPLRPMERKMNGTSKIKALLNHPHLVYAGLVALIASVGLTARAVSILPLQ